jgi:hypothetical protein
MGRTRNGYRAADDVAERKRPKEDLGIVGKITLNSILKKLTQRLWSG